MHIFLLHFLHHVAGQKVPLFLHLFWALVSRLYLRYRDEVFDLSLEVLTNGFFLFGKVADAIGIMAEKGAERELVFIELVVAFEAEEFSEEARRENDVLFVFFFMHNSMVHKLLISHSSKYKPV